MRIAQRIGMALLTIAFAATLGAAVAGRQPAGQPQPAGQQPGRATPPATPSPAPDARGAARGQYITHSVSMCIQCHTPRDGEGALLMSEAFMGAPMPVRTPFPRIEWAIKAPRIKGLPGYTREQAVRLLMEGYDRNGARPRSPMPPFRMNREDAEAVADFLLSFR